VIRPVRGDWHPHMPEHLDDEELADWRAGRNAVYQLAALTIDARLAVADGVSRQIMSSALPPIARADFQTGARKGGCLLPRQAGAPV